MTAARAVIGVGIFLLTGCASLNVDSNLTEARTLAAGNVDVDARPLRTAGQRDHALAEVRRMLETPLSSDDAVRIALAYSPSFQARLFERAAESAEATQAARLPNPVFTFERLIRREHGEVEKDLGRMLAFSVVDILLLPNRIAAADYRQRQLQVRLAGELVAAAAEARQAWVRAVAAEQAVGYAEQVKTAAEASAELARRMQAVGSFSKLQRAREQAFYADAAAQLARARHAAVAARETLVRTLGLGPGHAAMLKLPDRLPDLPAEPKAETAAAQRALDDRLDVRMAKAELDYLARQMGLTRITSHVDGLHVAAVRNSETGRAPQKGYEIEMPLPIFDFGDARRAQAEARYMSALYRTSEVAAAASSQVREAYATYRTAHGIAKHYRDEVVPLRKLIADEMLLKYNGMLIGVFELLADAREQIGSVTRAIEAQRDFWLADAALEATLIGRPMTAPLTETRASNAPASAGH